MDAFNLLKADSTAAKRARAQKVGVKEQLEVISIKAVQEIGEEESTIRREFID